MEYLKIDFDCCIYCGEPPEHWDHAFPLSESWRFEKGFVSWLVPSCAECNFLARAEMCETFGDKTRHIHKKLLDKYNNKESPRRLESRLDWRLTELANVRLVFRITEEEFIISNVYKRRRRKPPPKEKIKKIKTCDWCGEEFKPLQKWRKLCSNSCTQEWESYWQEDSTKHELGWSLERLNMQ